MPTALDVRTETGTDGTPRVVASGEIDLSNVAIFARALSQAGTVVRDTKALTVDLRDVKYLDSAAINTLFDHADQLDRLHLIVHPFLLPVLSISGLGKIATIEPAPGGSPGNAPD